MEGSAALAGHNSGNRVQILRDELAERHQPILARADELSAAYGRAPAAVDSDDIAGQMADFVKQFSTAIKRANDARTAEKEPHLEAGRVVDGFFKAVIDGLEAKKRALTDRLTAYQRKKAEEERQRRLAAEAAAREEAARKEREAREAAEQAKDDDSLAHAIAIEETAEQSKADAIEASAAASAKPAELSRTRGDYGALSSLRTSWVFEITDRAVLDLEKLRPYFAPADLDKAVRGFVRAGGRDLAGAHIYESTTAVVR
jgi:hypothetical protein